MSPEEHINRAVIVAKERACQWVSPLFWERLEEALRIEFVAHEAEVREDEGRRVTEIRT